MSPEVILCRGHSTKADIYSLGATLIHMQTGTPPWVKRYPRSAYPSYLYIVSGGSGGSVGLSISLLRRVALSLIAHTSDGMMVKYDHHPLVTLVYAQYANHGMLTIY